MLVILLVACLAAMSNQGAGEEPMHGKIRRPEDDVHANVRQHCVVVWRSMRGYAMLLLSHAVRGWPWLGRTRPGIYIGDARHIYLLHAW